MARRQLSRLGTRLAASGAIILAVLVSGGGLLQADASNLQNRFLKLNDSRPGVTAAYDFGFKLTDLDVLQMIVFQFCSDGPLPDTPCTPPAGFDASNAILGGQSGDAGFSLSAADSSMNKLVLRRPPLPSNAQADNYVFTNITNPAANGSYYVRILTYADSDTSVGANNYGGLAFAINNPVSVQATVPPYLLFCVGVTVNGYDCNNVVGNYVDFGQLDSRRTAQGSLQLLAASNAKAGYGIYMSGTTLTSGNNVIQALVGSNGSRTGSGQFGMNLRANSSPQGGIDPSGSGNGLPTDGYNQINMYRFNSGDLVAVSSAPDRARKYTASFIVNVTKDQAPGIYVSTLTYTATGAF